MGFKPRNTLNDMFELEIDMKVGKAAWPDRRYVLPQARRVETARVLDNVKAMGYKVFHHRCRHRGRGRRYRAAGEEADSGSLEKKVRAIEKQFKRGLLTDEERYERVVEV